MTAKRRAKARLDPLTSIRSFLAARGLPPDDLHALPDSTKRFPDGSQYRIEIPSTEGPRGLEAVIDEGELLDVTVHRASQGSGIMMLTSAELDEMVRLSAGASIELCLFVRPTADWDISAMARSPAGALVAATARGQGQLTFALSEIRRAADAGVRCILISDLGVLVTFAELRREGLLPPGMRAKVSVALPVANAATARALVGFGADTINLPTDLTLPQIAAIRSAVDVPLDVYVESNDGMGGFVRLHEIPEIIRVAAPVHLKFGLRNAPDLYPWGRHLEAAAALQSRERVRRARLGVELLARSGAACVMSTQDAADLAVPVIP